MLWVALALLAAFGLRKSESPAVAVPRAAAAAAAAALPLRVPQVVRAPVTDAAKAAASELASYLLANPQALRQSDLNVTVLQARMGGLVADGQVGPLTRARAAALGVTLPKGAV